MADPTAAETHYWAITLWQPWASLIAAGAKPLEFRHWPAPRRLWGQRIAIHAGARPVRRVEIQELIHKLRGPRWRETGLLRDEALALLEPVIVAPGSLPRSSVLCLATLCEPIRNEALSARLGVELVNDSDRDAHTNWGWPLADIEPLRPFVPATGAQGFWTWRSSNG